MNSLKQFLKDNWFVFLLILLATGFLWNKQSTFEEIVATQQKAHQQEVKILKDFHEIQIKERDALVEKYQIERADLERKYNRSRKQLRKERQKKIQIILQESPEQVAERIEVLYGFKNVSPSSNLSR